VIIQQPAPAARPPARETAPAPQKGRYEETSTTARVTIALPADARLWVDNVVCPVRSFTTPQLEPGRKYFYTLRAELVRDGRTVAETRRIIVSAGQETNVSFNDQLQTVRSE
jgi:uncharacterized protein (TIGR03000 family)